MRVDQSQPPGSISSESESAASKAGGDEFQIGKRLRRLRTEHGYSMRRLGELAGVSASLISDVERDRVEPSLSVLKRLATALGTPLTHFFSSPRDSESRVVRANDRRALGSNSAEMGAGIRFELASPDEARLIEAIVGQYDVGAVLGDDEPVIHEGEEWGMVLEGRLKVSVGDEVYFLDSGDAIWFPSHIPHRLENVASTITRYIWIDTPKTF